MVAAMRFLDDVAPPQIHGGNDPGEADAGGDRPIAVVVEPHDEAAEQEEGRQRADERVRAGFYEMIVVVLRTGHVRASLVIFALASSGPERRFPPGKMCSSE